MAGTPKPQSYEQILGRMLATYMSKIGVNDLNTGSVVTSFFETFAQQTYRVSGDIFSILRDNSVDRAEGEALRRIAAEEYVNIPPARVATGRVTISDSTFQKISTKIYAGSPPPNIGSTSILVSDASNFPSTGQIYLGRGTPNVEGPISYSSIDNLGSFYRINLSSPTTKYHNNSESIVLAQGGTRNIPSGQVIQTVTGGATQPISFTVTTDVSILDGENVVTNVPVAAQEPGSDGNVSRNSLREFVMLPFTGAEVTNPNPFTTGRNEATDQEIRNAIKRARIAKGLGTALAVENSVLNAQADDENAIVTSSKVFNDGEQTTLYIDNGEGYEEKTAGVGLEYIVDSALGGEDRFQLPTGGSQTSIAKAFLISTQTSPFGIRPNDRLAILVGGVLSEHVFLEGDFRANGSVTAYEVVASINANSDLAFSARTVDNGTKVSISAKSESAEFLQKTIPTSGNDAGFAMGLPVTEVQTLRLYKNNIPLSRNGRSAIIETNNQSDWGATIVSGDNLIVSVDGTQQINYTFTDNDFLQEGTHISVSPSNSIQSWVNVINNKIIGVTASINGNRISLTSNLDASERASLSIDPTSSLVVKGMFDINGVLESQGRTSDFTLSRNTGQFRLKAPLQAGDSLTAGSDFTEGAVESGLILGGNITLTSPAQMWVLVDAPDAHTINHGVASDTVIHFTKEPSNVVRIRSDQANAFANIQAGDYAIIWSPQLNGNNRFEARVLSVGTDQQPSDYVEFKLTTNEYAAAIVQTPVVYSEGIEFVRTNTPPQKLDLPVNTYSVSDIATQFEEQISGVSAKTIDDEKVVVSTLNKDRAGEVFIVAFDESGQNLLFTKGDRASSTFSHYAYFKSDSNQDQFPLFVHDKFTQDRVAQPSVNFIQDVVTNEDLSTMDIEPNVLMHIKNQYLVNGINTEDAQPANEFVQIDSINNNTVEIDDSRTIKRLRANDRYYLTQPLNFDFNDSLAFILDNNPADKTFPINMYRRGVTNTTMPVNSDKFRAYDADAGNVEFSDFFTDFSFKNYKIMMKARNVIDPVAGNNEDAVLYRSAIWGEGGEKFRVGYVYPSGPNQTISHSVNVGENVDVELSLKSGAPVVNTIDGTTEWDVIITPNSPVAGVDTVQYVWNGNGTNPTMTTLSAGHYVTINSNGSFDSANTGTFRLTAATSTSFTTTRTNGIAVAETGIATLTNNTVSLYENSNTTAQEMVDYVNDNVFEWLSAEIIDDNGVNGAGVISLSTAEDTDYQNNYISLVDGINWIQMSDLTATAPNEQFELKKTLQLPFYNTNTANAYRFNDGEEFRLIPTTIPQVSEFIQTLTVSGISTLGNVETSTRDQVLQISSQILGSDGAVRASGGSANGASANVIGAASKINGLMKLDINKSSSAGIGVSNWVKVEATSVQNKEIGLSFTTQIQIDANQPTANESLITLSNKEDTDLYFGQPRNHVRTRGRSFEVEKHGSLVCISWDENGSSPAFTKNVEINDALGGDIVVSYSPSSMTTSYTVVGGGINFIEVRPEDSITLSNFNDAQNNGSFNVIGVSEDGTTIVTDNESGVSAASQTIASGDIAISTEVSEGDTVEISSPFAALNQGRFTVIRRYKQSIYIDNPSAVEERVTVNANLKTIGGDVTTEYDVINNGHMRIEWNGNGTQPDLSVCSFGDEFTVGTGFAANNQGVFMVIESGNNYVHLANAKSTNESGVTVSGVGGDVIECHTPALIISPYNCVRVGDKLSISGNVLSEDNQGVYTISKVLSDKKAAVSSIMVSQPATQLNNLFTQVTVQENKPYVGYKKIVTKATNPFNTQRISLVLESSEQFEKINQSFNTKISVIGKLGFSTESIQGFDAYRYHTGLMREVNKIVYGDPRDSTTYPGVSAAGAEIFTMPPLVRRVEIDINIRVRTGIPFVRVSEQVRNNIAALVNSTDIGESIAISDIIASVNNIPGVRAVSISSPLYDVNNDIIVIQPSEKPFVLDSVNDIVVSKVGE